MNARSESSRFLEPVVVNSVRRVKEALLAGLNAAILTDVAFVGNASEVYRWEPGGITDIDACVFVYCRDLQVGNWLLGLTHTLTRNLLETDIDFELRMSRRSYKPGVAQLARPIILLHLSVVTEQSYATMTPLLRWAWRKYECHSDPARLARLAPERPSVRDLLHGRGGVKQRLADIELGYLPMIDLCLPDFREEEWTAYSGDPFFAEHCLASGATCARNHARVLGKPEPDTLGNEDFLEWYSKEVLYSRSLREIFALKSRVRNEGYQGALTMAPSLAYTYLKDLERELGKFR